MEKPKTARGNPYAIGENPYLREKLTKKSVKSAFYVKFLIYFSF